MIYKIKFIIKTEYGDGVLKIALVYAKDDSQAKELFLEWIESRLGSDKLDSYEIDYNNSQEIKEGVMFNNYTYNGGHL